MLIQNNTQKSIDICEKPRHSPHLNIIYLLQTLKHSRLPKKLRYLNLDIENFATRQLI